MTHLDKNSPIIEQLQYHRQAVICLKTKTDRIDDRSDGFCTQMHTKTEHGLSNLLNTRMTYQDDLPVSHVLSYTPTSSAPLRKLLGVPPRWVSLAKVPGRGCSRSTHAVPVEVLDHTGITSRQGASCMHIDHENTPNHLMILNVWLQ